MPNEPFLRRARGRPPLTGGGRLERALGHPIAFLATTVVLLLVFGWTFFTNPARPAAADDPAYYQWRTEALLANDPADVIDIGGPLDMYTSGYRVATPVVAGLMRQIADVGPFTPTIAIGVALRVAIPVLLAGFAYRWRRDPVLWHATAFFVASLLPTPPFAGYVDNVMTLLFLSASLYLIEPLRRSWPARVSFVALLLVSGFTHPTTLAIFCATLGVASFIRFVVRGFALKRTLADDAWMLGCAVAAAVLTYVTWKVGIWGVSASLGDAAVPPPADADFFQKRLGGWVRTFRLPLNGPLLLIGLVGILRAGRAALEETLPRLTLAWLAPLVGVAGALVGLAYPYYRFFNTTTAWLLLIGIGGYLVMRFCLDLAARWSFPILSLVAVALLGAVVVGNFRTGLADTGWNDPADGWIKPDELRDLDALRPQLENEDRPVVFVVDDEVPVEVRIYGFLKLAGNVLRYAVPPELQDRTGVYLGSLENYRAGEPTDRDPYYRSLSEASLEDVQSVVGDDEPVVVVADVFNKTGANAGAGPDDDIVHVADGSVTVNGVTGADDLGLERRSGILHALLAVVLSALLLLPGVGLVRWALPETESSDVLGLVPAFAAASLALVGIGALAITSSPLSAGAAWVTVGFTLALSLAGYLWRRSRSPAVRGSAPAA